MGSLAVARGPIPAAHQVDRRSGAECPGIFRGIGAGEDSSADTSGGATANSAGSEPRVSSIQIGRFPFNSPVFHQRTAGFIQESGIDHLFGRPELPGNMTGLAGHHLEMAFRVGKEAMPSLGFVAGLAVGVSEAMIGLSSDTRSRFPAEVRRAGTQSCRFDCPGAEDYWERNGSRCTATIFGREHPKGKGDLVCRTN